MCLTCCTESHALLLGCPAVTSFDSSPQLNVWRTARAGRNRVSSCWRPPAGPRCVTTGASHRPCGPLLTAWEHGRINGHAPARARRLPTRLAHFFASLTPHQLQCPAVRYPLAVGNMNSAPAQLRYSASRTALGQARRVEYQRMHDDRLSSVGHADARQRMKRFALLAHPDRKILAFDPWATAGWPRSSATSTRRSASRSWCRGSTRTC